MYTARIHHVGIVIQNREKLKRFKKLLNLEEDYSGYVKEYDAECIFMKTQGTQIEFVIPKGRILKNYNKGLGGLHHIAIEIQNIRKLQSELEQRGIKLLEEESVKGAGNFLINFLSPIYLGVTIEFVQILDKEKNDL